MPKLNSGALVDKLLFSAMLVGLLLAVIGGLRYVDLSNRLADNPAAQIHQSGGEVQVESAGEGYSLMTADIERRRMVDEQYSMMIVGGAGLALLGLGWLVNDIVKARRRKTPLGPPVG